MLTIYAAKLWPATHEASQYLASLLVKYLYTNDGGAGAFGNERFRQVALQGAAGAQEWWGGLSRVGP
jgi:hypothetical protein